MGRTSLSPVDSPSDDATAFHSIRDRFPFKRNSFSTTAAAPRSSKTPSSHKAASRSHHHHHHKRRLSLSQPFRGKSRYYFCVFAVIFAFALASVVLQSSITSVLRQGVGGDRIRWRWSVKEGLKLGSSLEFVQRNSELNVSRLDWLRTQPRIGIRPPRIGLILGNMKKDPSTLMLYSVMKNLRGLGYLLKLFALKDGRARPIWQEMGGQVSILSPERYGYIDWSIFEGVVVDSLEAKDAISSLMQEPFCSVPLIWIIQEDSLANRLQHYENMSWDHLISNWKNAFSRANAVVFPEFSFPVNMISDFILTI